MGWGDNTESIYGGTGMQGAQGGQGGQGGQAAEPEEVKQEENANTVTLSKVLDRLCQEQGFVEALLGNLRGYCERVQEKARQDPSALSETDRTRLHLVSPKHSH